MSMPSKRVAGASQPPDILVLPMTDWHARIQRAQQLSMAWSAMGHRCFYLNPHLGREFPRPARIGPRLRVCEIGRETWEIHSGLVREPVFHHRLLDPVESRTIAGAIAQVLEQAGTRPGELMILTQLPVWVDVARELRRKFRATMVYDCHDWLAGFSGIAPEIVAAEPGLLRQADLVVVSAKSLLEKLLAVHPWLLDKSTVVRNGVDIGRFGMAAGSGRRVAGYAGAIEEWFDASSVREAARANPQCDFIILGRVENRQAPALLSDCRNVRFFGEIPYDRLPAHMAQFDIGLIPFAVTPLTLATNPIKLYEYFSCGLPVVSSDLPEVASFGDLVYIACDPAGFAQQVRLALAEPGDVLRARRRALAEKESWQSRAAAIVEAATARKMEG